MGLPSHHAVDPSTHGERGEPRDEQLFGSNLCERTSLPLIIGRLKHRLLHPDLGLHDRGIRGLHDDIEIGGEVLGCQRR